MATFSKQLLSGTAGSGRGILIAATATPGTLVHTAHATAMDEVYVFLHNSDTTPWKVTIEFGGVTSPNDLIEVTVPAESGLLQVIPGLPLTGAVVVRAFAATANVISAHGFVNRIT